jgi:hypothetical protein
LRLIHESIFAFQAERSQPQSLIKGEVGRHLRCADVRRRLIAKRRS